MKKIIIFTCFISTSLFAQDLTKEKLYLAEFALTQKDTSQAIELLHQYLQEQPTSIAGALRLAEVYYQQNELSKAISYSNIAIDILKEKEKEYTLVPYEESIDTVKGSKHYQKYEKVKKDLSSLYQLAGRIRQKQENYEMADKNFQIAYDFYASNENILIDHANLKINTGEYKDAQRMLYTALEINPKNASAYYNLGYLFLDKNDTAKAVSFFEKSIAIDSLFVPGFQALARLYYQDENFEKAIKYYTDWLNADSINLEALYNRAYAFKQVDNNEQAVKDWQTISDYYPDQIEVVRYQGLTFMEMRRYPAAINSFNRYIRFRPDDRLGYLNRGYIYMILNEFDLAHQDFDKLLQLNNEDAQAFYYKSYAFALQGKKRKACKSFDTALALGYDQKQIDDLLKELCN
jgi:tetratricopeptide (TPR) repeat protein